MEKTEFLSAELQTICQQNDLEPEFVKKLQDFEAAAYMTFTTGPMNQIPNKVADLVRRVTKIILENQELKRENERLRESSDNKSSHQILQERRMVGGSREIIGTGDEFF